MSANVYDQGVGHNFDIAARNHSPHPGPGGKTVSGRLLSMRRIMRANGDADKPLWVTETWYASIPEWGVTVAGKADGLIESARAALREGGASL